MRRRTAALGACAMAALAACTVDRGPAAIGQEVVIASAGASNPTVAVDDAGEFFVAWVGTEGGESDVFLARSSDAVTFDRPVRVNDIRGDAAPHEQAPAQVAVGPGGQVYVAWQNATHAEGRRFPYSDVRFARSTDGGRTFSPAITVNDDGGGPPSSHTFHDLEVAPDGTVYVSWIDSRVRTAAEHASAPDASIGHAAHGARVQDRALPGPEIRVARSDDGGRTFVPGVVAGTNACPCCRTTLAVGSDGVVYVAWRDAGEDNVRDMVIARSDDRGASFAPPAVVHADGWRIDGCPHAGPALAVDAEGRLHAAWYTGADGRAGLYHAVSDDGGRTFADPAPLVAGAWVPVSQVKLAAAHNGVWVVWDDRRTEPAQVVLARAPGAGHGSAQLTMSLAGAGASPAIAASARHRAIAWLSDGGIRFRGRREES